MNFLIVPSEVRQVAEAALKDGFAAARTGARVRSLRSRN